MHRPLLLSIAFLTVVLSTPLVLADTVTDRPFFVNEGDLGDFIKSNAKIVASGILGDVSKTIELQHTWGPLAVEVPGGINWVKTGKLSCNVFTHQDLQKTAYDLMMPWQAKLFVNVFFWNTPKAGGDVADQTGEFWHLYQQVGGMDVLGWPTSVHIEAKRADGITFTVQLFEYGYIIQSASFGGPFAASRQIATKYNDLGGPDGDLGLPSSNVYDWKGLQRQDFEGGYITRKAKTREVWAKLWVAREPGGQIAFVRDGDIWVMRADGTRQKRLTTTGDCSRPIWMKDGSAVIYSRAAEPDPTICRITIKSGRYGMLTRGRNAALSPDGKWVALDRCLSDDKRLVLLHNLKTREERSLIRDASAFNRSSGPWVWGWTSGGDAVVVGGDNFTAASDAAFRLPVATGKLEYLCGGYRPQNTRMGSVVTQVHSYYRDRSGANEFLFEAAVPGPSNRQSRARRLTAWDMTEGSPRVSPSGRILAFSAADTGFVNDDRWRGKSALIIYDLAGRSSRVILERPNSESYGPIAWSPDGRWLCFCKAVYVEDEPTPRRSSLWLIKPDGTGLRKIADNASEPAWSPVPRAAP